VAPGLRAVSQPPMPNPVRAQAAMLAEEMRAEPPMPREPLSPVETLILGTDEAPEIEDDIPPMPSIVTRPAAMREPVAETPAEPKRRGIFRAWSERKVEARTEPTPMRPVQQARASSQVMARAAQPEQRATVETQLRPDDLFPDHKKEDQFEIPAFLR